MGDEDWQLSKDSADAATALVQLTSCNSCLTDCVYSNTDCTLRQAVRENEKSGIKTVTELLPMPEPQRNGNCVKQNDKRRLVE